MTQDELTTLLSQIIQNAFSITDDENDLNSSIGLGLWTSASIMNHSCQPNAVQTFRYGMEGCCPRLIVTTVVGSGGGGNGGGVAMGEEICIAYNDVMQVKERRRDELWNDYKFWCDCVRCGGRTTVSVGGGGCGGGCEEPSFTTTSSNGNETEDTKEEEGVLTYDELTRRLRCPTDGCRGYGVSDSRSNAGEVVVVVVVEEAEEQEEMMTYHCNICGRSDGFNSMVSMRDRSLQVVDDFWARRQPTNSITQSESNSQWSITSSTTSSSSRARILQGGQRGAQQDSTPSSLTLLSDSVIIDKLQSSYESMKKCCSHLSSWYVQYAGDALVRALLDRAVTMHSDQNHHSSSATDQEITTEGMGHYTQAHSILEELNKGCLLSSSSSSSSSNGSSSHHPPPSSVEVLHRRQRPQLLSPLSLLQNRYRAAKLELFLNPDPRKAISELQDLLREYLVYYPSEHEWIKGLRRCIQSGFQ